VHGHDGWKSHPYGLVDIRFISKILRTAFAKQNVVDAGPTRRGDAHIYTSNRPETTWPSMIVAFAAISRISSIGAVSKSSSHTTASNRFPGVSEPVVLENDAYAAALYVSDSTSTRLQNGKW
jgi:hypothetical protein